MARRPSAKTTAAATSPQPPDGDAILDAALAEIWANGWAGFTLAAAAARLGIPVAAVVAVFPDRGAILPALLARADRAMLAGVSLEDEAATTRDRLFDLLMRRLDALAPHKAALKAVSRDLSGDPAAAVALVRAGHASMRRVLEAAGVPSHGLRGLAQVEGLVAVQAWTVRVWLDDDDPSQDRTLKALDRALARACGLRERLCRRRVAPRGTSAAAPPDGEPVAMQG